MVAAFTVAVIGLACVRAAESVTLWASGLPIAPAEPQRRLGERGMRTSGMDCRVPQSRLGIVILVRVRATCQRASLKACSGASQCQGWSLSLGAPHRFPMFEYYLYSEQLWAEALHLGGPARQEGCLGAQLALQGHGRRTEVCLGGWPVRRGPAPERVPGRDPT